MKRGPTGRYEARTVGGESVRSFVPFALPPEPTLALSGPVQRLLERASLALGRLDSVSTLLPDTDLFLYAYDRYLALLSEGTEKPEVVPSTAAATTEPSSPKSSTSSGKVW